MTSVVGIAVAAAPAGQAVIQGCRGPGGTLRIVDTAQQCLTTEQSLSWNTQGPVGPVGPPGPSDVYVDSSRNGPALDEDFQELAAVTDLPGGVPYTVQWSFISVNFAPVSLHIGCYVTGGGGTERPQTVQPLSSSETGGVTTLTLPSYLDSVRLECRAARQDGEPTSVPTIHVSLVVTRVGTLHVQ